MSFTNYFRVHILLLLEHTYIPDTFMEVTSENIMSCYDVKYWVDMDDTATNPFAKEKKRKII